MKIEKGHLHAFSLYQGISALHFVYLWLSLVTAKLLRCKSVTCHLPLEMQHSEEYRNIKLAKKFIRFGQRWKKRLKIKLYWENAPLLVYGVWNLKHGQTDWSGIPRDIELCLDTGHLMLGARSKRDARNRIRNILKDRRDQIKHLHLHENDLEHDLHAKQRKILSKKLLNELKKGRTFIYEG